MATATTKTMTTPMPTTTTTTFSLQSLRKLQLHARLRQAGRGISRLVPGTGTTFVNDTRIDHDDDERPSSIMAARAIRLAVLAFGFGQLPWLPDSFAILSHPLFPRSYLHLRKSKAPCKLASLRQNARSCIGPLSGLQKHLQGLEGRPGLSDLVCCNIW